MATIYAVIDTNVIVSALLTRNRDAATARVLDMVISQMRITPLYNDEIITEYNNVLKRETFGFPSELIDAIINLIVVRGLDSQRVSTTYEHFPDPKAVVFYEVALSKEDAYLVTGNIKHFPRTPIVVTPAEMIAMINQSFP